MTGIDIIVAALAAGAAAGVSGAATVAVQDASAALRELLRRRLVGRANAERALDTLEREPTVWQVRIADDLASVGADQDEEVLAAARLLLGLVDPAGSLAGRYLVDGSGAVGMQIGDRTVHIDTNYGAAAGTMTGPVTITYGQPPVPPGGPGTV